MRAHVAEIREHTEVVGGDGGHVGTVDKVAGDRVKLTKRDDPDGSGQHQRDMPVSAIGSEHAEEVRLRTTAERARAFATTTGTSGHKC